MLTVCAGLSRLFGEMTVAALKIPKESTPLLLRMNYLYFGLLLTTAVLLIDVFGSLLAIKCVDYFV